MKTVEFQKEEKFNWLEIIKSYTSSQEWAESHPLRTIEQLDMAIKVGAIFEAEGGTADDDVINYICEAAGALTFIPGGNIEALGKLRLFKVYFKELQASKGETLETLEKTKVTKKLKVNKKSNAN